MPPENMNVVSDEIAIDIDDSNITKIIPMDDVILEIVWSDEHARLICIARTQI